jgi:tRNA (cytidine/uridine-2'-O-)-methyltransferase
MKIVLVAPEIPGNTGTIGRTCVALDMELILIRPFGFELTDKTVRRAGLDYWKHVRLSEYPDWEAFMADRAPERTRLFLFEDDGGAGTVFDADYPEGAYLVFGRETTGLPPGLTADLVGPSLSAADAQPACPFAQPRQRGDRGCLSGDAGVASDLSAWAGK